MLLRSGHGSGEQDNTSPDPRIDFGIRLTGKQGVMHKAELQLSQKTSTQPLSNDELDAWLAQRLAILQTAFPNQPLTTEANVLYLTELEVVFNEIGGDGLVSALSRCIRELKFMPTIAEIRDIAGLNQKKQEIVDAEKAWTLVLQYVERWSGVERIYRGQDPNTGEIRWEYPPKLPTYIEYAVRAAGGVRCIANTSPEDLPFRIKEFREAIENGRHCPEFRQLSAGSQEPASVLRGVSDRGDHSNG